MPPSKKLKRTPSPALAQIKSLEQSLLQASASLNPLVPLLAHLSAPEPEVVHAAVYSLGRVFVSLAAQGRLAFEKAKSETDGERQVREWSEARVGEWVTGCQGLMKDVEPDLRSAGLLNLLGLLPALCPPSSSSSSSSSSTTSPSSAYPASHLRAILQPFLFPSPSPRGVEFTLTPTPEDDEDETEDEEEQPLEVEQDVVEKLGEKMVEFRDLRWAVYREISFLLRPFIANPSSAPRTLAPNVLTLLSTQPSPIPSTQKALEKTPVYMTAFKSRPFISHSISKKERLDEDDWRAFYESDSEESDDGAPKARGVSAPGKGKRKEIKSKGPKGAKKELGGRVKQMTSHEGIWSLESLKAGFTSAWMGLLSLPLEPTEARRILVVLHHQVLPNMTSGRAVRTADWLGEWVDRGGPLGLLALNGLFILITKYNLDYPDFYTRLYALCDRSVLHVKYRSRFFRLAETFLASSHLPAALIASFIKRLARLALFAPAAGTVLVIPFVYNLLKMHPSCMVLIHRDTYGGEELSLDESIAKDPYDPSHPSPLESHALDSSLWEIASLQKHYLSSISSLAKIFGEVFTKPKYGMEDFLDHTYMTMFDTESKRHLKNDPALALPVEGVAFPLKRKAVGNEEEEMFIGRDAVADLWTF